MSYFLCLALPKRFASTLSLNLDTNIRITDVSSYPIGKATNGDRSTWSSFLLQIGSSSASLIGKASNRKTHNSDLSHLLIEGLKKIMTDNEHISIVLLIHWMQGYITVENINVKSEQEIILQNLHHIIRELDEDIRYVIKNNI